MPEQKTLPPFLLLEPQYRDYVWGGHKLRPGEGITAEAWIVFEQDVITNGAYQGKTLAELTRQFGKELLGEKAFHRTGTRFPLLIKLLDCAQWLSIQVHPNDEQAAKLAGPGQFGKTEAWHTLEAEPGALIIAGVQPGVTAEELRQGIQDGSIERLAQYLPLKQGDTVLMLPGTLHALGPGLLIYEVQQTSDLTYRVYDWGRPASENRLLHIEQSLAVARHDAYVEPSPPPEMFDGEEKLLCTSDYFTLSMLYATTQPIRLDTGSETFHALTVIEGKARLAAGCESIQLARFDSVLIPASTGAYELEPNHAFKVLKSSVGKSKFSSMEVR
jgi:mannose-6-phosphate isomerase